MNARAAVNANRDRTVQARAALGEDQLDDGGYPIRDQPAYSVELDGALGAEARARSGDQLDALQRELNGLDELP